METRGRLKGPASRKHVNLAFDTAAREKRIRKNGRGLLLNTFYALSLSLIISGGLLLQHLVLITRFKKYLANLNSINYVKSRFALILCEICMILLLLQNSRNY